ncbi:protease complex subunit PrcB family protein [Deinococcus sonorensis]|uniref:Protease complex subunit PrcB family protein n=2 Tax=Deinococcus sonorensis TaxID=309891 RepID=A0AAU7U9U2_9DEIO
MKTKLGVGLILGLALLSGCSMQNPSNLSVHEALLYGSSQERIVWIYGNVSGGSSAVKLGAVQVELKAQLADDALALPGTLSIDGRATYRGVTQPLGAQLSVTRSAQNGTYTIQAGGNLGGVYLTDGTGWFRLSGAISAGQTVLATPQRTTSLRGAGSLTDAEADALGSQLLGKGVLVVAVLPDSVLPDAPLAVEPAPTAERHLLTGLYVQSGVVTSSAATAPATTPVSSAARQVAGGNNAASDVGQLIVARDASALASLWSVAYGLQTTRPPLPTLSAGHSVVGVFLGQRPTGGYGLSLNSARISGGVLELTVNVTTPAAGAITTQALTSPWIAVDVAGSFTSVSVRDTSGKALTLR